MVRTALVYGSLASSSFVVGVVLGLFTSPPRRLVASVVAFGAGVLVSALTFELMREAFDTGGATYAIGGFLLGAAIYVVADVGLERMAAKSPKRTGRDATDVVPDADRKRESPEVAAVAGTALLVGAVLDGIPESIAKMPPAARARIPLVGPAGSPDSSAYPATVAMMQTTATMSQAPMM